MSETDAEIIQHVRRMDTPTDADPRRRYTQAQLEMAIRLARRGAAVQATPAFTEGHCEHKNAPGGCPLHNLHCGYPDCDRRPLPPPPAGEPEHE